MTPLVYFNIKQITLYHFQQTEHKQTTTISNSLVPLAEFHHGLPTLPELDLESWKPFWNDFWDSLGALRRKTEGNEHEWGIRFILTDQQAIRNALIQLYGKMKRQNGGKGGLKSRCHL